MTLWFLFALMTALAVFAVLWPLRRSREPAPSGSDVAVYRDQLQELEPDHLVNQGRAAASDEQEQQNGKEAVGRVGAALGAGFRLGHRRRIV